VELLHKSILDVGRDDGVFDYIICHGVYSWVPSQVQDKILEICDRNLAPNGVAYVSYNTYPGWFLRGMVRRMMCYHARQFQDPQTQVQQARALLDFLIDAGPVGDDQYHALLRRELEIVRGRQDSYLFHEHLEEDNEPLFFQEFIERAERHGLRYLAEAQFSEMVAANFSPQVEKTLRELGAGLIHSEQYLDFLRNRTFRRTLLCHAGIELNRQLGANQLKGLYVASGLKPASPQPDLTAHAPETFQGAQGPAVTVSHPLLKSALVRLSERWPEPVLFESLPALAAGAGAKALVRDADRFQRDLDELGGLVLELYAKDLVELRPCPPRFAARLPERPTVSPLVRLQAEDGRYATNLRHEIVDLGDLARHLARLLDGTRTRNDVLAALAELVEGGQLVVERYGTPIRGQHDLRQLLDELLTEELNDFVRKALLVPGTERVPTAR
jgi:methyltransferase-like protein